LVAELFRAARLSPALLIEKIHTALSLPGNAHSFYN
jgi:hypothetical protein